MYTTPLKALSNQKLYEFRRLFGTERVGLQTGDASLNAEGDVVVMTTEVMRNIMYRGAHDASTGSDLLIARFPVRFMPGVPQASSFIGATGAWTICIQAAQGWQSLKRRSRPASSVV